MEELINPEGKNLVDLMHSQEGKDMPSIPTPFERDIFLFDTYVAGTSHVEGIEELAQFIHEGDRLEFKREPKNRHDENAIRIQNGDGVKLGYVPKKDNVVFSRLMDAGKLLFGKVTFVQKKENWVYIKIKVYLHE